MSEDILDELRGRAQRDLFMRPHYKRWADEIERLRKENEVLGGLWESATTNIHQLRAAIIRNGGKDWIP